MNKYLCAALLAATLCSCASLDGPAMTRLGPPKQVNGADQMTFTAIADLVYPPDSQDAEQIRMTWLRGLLDRNGYAGRDFEIVSRQPVKEIEALLGNGYRIYYEIRLR